MKKTPKMLTFQAPADLVLAVDELAKQQKRTRSEVLRGLVEKGLSPSSPTEILQKITETLTLGKAQLEMAVRTGHYMMKLADIVSGEEKTLLKHADQIREQSLKDYRNKLKAVGLTD